MEKAILRMPSTNPIRDIAVPDFTIILNGHKLKYHKSILQDIEAFRQEFKKEQPWICQIGRKLNKQIFKKVIEIYYGKQYQFQRSWQAFYVMEILAYLQVEDLKQKVKEDIFEYLEEYDFFVVFGIAHKFQCQELEQKCLIQLHKLHFQQINIHKYDLLQLEKETFQYIIELHEGFKKLNLIKGIGRKNIIKIVRQYCQINKVQMDQERLLKVDMEKHAELYRKISALLKQKYDCLVQERLMQDQLGDEGNGKIINTHLTHLYSDSSSNCSQQGHYLKVDNLRNGWKTLTRSHRLESIQRSPFDANYTVSPFPLIKSTEYTKLCL